MERKVHFSAGDAAVERYEAVAAAVVAAAAAAAAVDDDGGDDVEVDDTNAG